MKNGIHTKKGPKTRKKLARKKAFALFVKTLQYNKANQTWSCCGEVLPELVAVHKHVAVVHKKDIESRTEDILRNDTKFPEDEIDVTVKQLTSDPSGERSDDVMATDAAMCCYGDSVSFPWLPTDEETEQCQKETGDGRVLLYYCYTEIDQPQQVCSWQQELCKRLQLTGKIRIASEGLNGTVGGSMLSTQLYIKYIMLHPMFATMATEDFKTSPGGRHSFPVGLKVTVHEEIVPMGVDPTRVGHHEAGPHLSVDEFHDVVSHLDSDKDKDTILVDCRNFYESKIGKFKNALAPNIRKFSYWPEYVDKNLHIFEDKKVLMYCTGGIRCERGSAYLRSKGVCKDVLQLKGGIHKYIEKYPNGSFRGKLFVFDDRYAIPANSDIISKCTYCNTSWDQYQPCTSNHCHQLVLSCTNCQHRGLTSCCHECQTGNDKMASRSEIANETREECSCTKSRERIPVENLDKYL
ncbi:thiosulfate sulfurtransferase/rhodanese-like domain-containing protein 2 [Glandiceps talaboti]